MVSLKEEYKSAVKQLRDSGNDNAEFDAGQLFTCAFGFDIHSPKAEAETAQGLVAFKMMIQERTIGYAGDLRMTASQQASFPVT